MGPHPESDDSPPKGLSHLADESFLVVLQRENLFDEFESAWRSATRPNIETFLGRVPEKDRDIVLQELLAIELNERLRRGDIPDFKEYQARFPSRSQIVDVAFCETMNTPENRQPPRVARFQTIDRLGVGGQGEVWLVLDPQIDRHVALKIVKPSQKQSQRTLIKFQREAIVTGKLEHPNIVPVYDVTDELTPTGKPDQNSPCYLMRIFGDPRLHTAIEAFHARPRSEPDKQLLHALRKFERNRSDTHRSALEQARQNFDFDVGQECDKRLRSAIEAILDRDSESGSLAKAITKFHSSQWSDSEFRKLLSRFQRVCEGVAYAHSRGVIHRDLKPDNVMLGEFGETLVADWGLAKVVDCSNESHYDNGQGMIRAKADSDNAHQSMLGDVMGTPEYMPPEQAKGRLDELGTASDIYSLGAILYCILTGKAPIGATSRQKHGRAIEPTSLSTDEIISRVKCGEFPAPSQIEPRVPKALEAITLKAMSLVPRDRYPTAIVLAEKVQRWMNDEEIGEYKDPWPKRLQRWAKKNPRTFASTAAAVIVATIATTILTVVVNYKNAELDKTNLALSSSVIRETSARKSAELSEQEAIRQLVNRAEEAASRSYESRQYDQAAAWYCEAERQENRRPEDQSNPTRQRLRISDLFSRTPSLKHVVKETGQIVDCQLDEKGERLMTFTYDGGVSRVRIWDVRNGKLRNGAIPEMTESRRIATMSRSGRYLAIDAELGLTLDQRSASVELWDLDKASRIGEPRSTNGPVSFLGINEADRRVVCVTRDSFASMKKDKNDPPEPRNLSSDEGGQITAYDLDSFEPIGKPFDLRVPTSSVSTDHQTRRLAVHTLADQNQLHLWDVLKHESIPLPRGIGDTHSAALDSTGQFLAIGILDGRLVHFWDLTTNIESRSPVPVVGQQPGILFVDRTDVVKRSATALVFDDDRIPSRSRTFARLVQTSLDLNYEIELDGGVTSVSKRSSSDGLVVAIGTYNGRVHLVNKLVGNEVSLPVKHSNEILLADFIGAGNELVTVSSDGLIRIWTMEGLKESRLAKHRPREWGGNPAPYRPSITENQNKAPNPRTDEIDRRNAIELSEDFRFIAEVNDSTQTHPSLRLSDATTNELRWSTPLPDGFTADRIAILKVGELIVVSSQKAPHWLPSEQEISLTNSFRDRWQQETTAEKTQVIVFSSDTGHPVGNILDLPGPVVACEFLTDQRVLLVGNDRSGGSGFVQIHHLATDNAAPLSHEMRGAISARWNPLAQELGVLLQSGKVERLMFRDGNWQSLSEAGNLVRQIDRFPGGGIAMGDFFGKIGIIKPDGSYVERMLGEGFVAGVSASPDGNFLAAIVDENQKGRISLVRVDGMRVVQTVRRNQELFLVRHSPDGRMLAVTDRFGDVEILDATNLRPVVRTLVRETVVNRHLFPSELRFSADSRQLMLKHRGGVAEWDLTQPETNWEQQVMLAFGTKVDTETGMLRDMPLDAPAEYENFLREMYPDDEWLAWLQFYKSIKNSNFDDVSKFLPTVRQLVERTEDSGVTSALADYYWQRQEFKQALQFRRKLMAKRSDDTTTLIKYAQNNLQIAPEESLAALEKCEKIYRQQSNLLLPLAIFWQGHARAQLGDWKKAEEDFESFRTSPWFLQAISPNAAVNCSILLSMGEVSLANGNHEKYREFCGLAVTSAVQSKDIEAITATLSLTTLRPDGLDDYSTVLPLAAHAAKNKEDDANYRLAYGAALFRAGKSKEAITELNESKRLMEAGGAVNSRYAKALPSYFLALTYAQMEDGDKPQRLLATAREEVRMFREKSEANGEAINWATRLMLESLDAEATRAE